MNVWCGVGNLTRNPDVHQGDTPVTTFTLAVNDRKSTLFIKCVCFRKTGELAAQYLSKGRQVAVSGAIQCRKWEDKEGNKRESWECVVNNLKFLSRGQNAAETPPKQGEPDEESFG